MKMKIAVLSVVFLLFALAASPDYAGNLRMLPGDSGIGPAAGNQIAPAISFGGGALLTVWSDERPNVSGRYEGETSRDIYGLRLDPAGNPIDRLPIAIVARKSNQDNPKVVWNGTNWLVVYESYDLGGTGYYYQKSLNAVRVSPQGQVLDAAPIILFGLEPSGTTWDVASDGNNWVVVNQGTSTSSDIVAVRISADGVLLDPPTRALVKATYYLFGNIRLAYADGVFLMTIKDRSSNGSNDTKYVRFDQSLNVLDPVPVPFLNVPIEALASNGTGFYAVWNQRQPDYSMVVTGTRVSTAGKKLDGNGDALSGPNPAQANAAISAVWDGSDWRVAWMNNNTVRTARVTATGRVLDPGGVAVPGPQTGPMAGNGAGGVQLAWQGSSENNFDIFSAAVAPDNSSSPVRVLSTSAPRQIRSDVATNGNGYLVVYNSGGANENRIVAQPLDAAGVPLTPEPVQLDSAPPSKGTSAPSVAWNGSVYMAAWSNADGVVAQRLLPDGSKVDKAPVVVMDTSFGPADVAALGGDFLVTGRALSMNNIEYVIPVAARVRGADGAVLDSSPLVLGSFFAGAPKAVALGGRWLVAWHSNASHDNPLAYTRGAFVGPDGSKTAEFTIHGAFSTGGGNGIFEVGLASNGSVAVMVQSQELTSGVENDLLCRFIAADGTVGQAINLTPWEGNQYKPRVAWDGTYFIVAYQDQKNRIAPWSLEQLDARSDLFGMRITPGGTIVDPQGFVFSAGETGEADPNVAAANGVTLFTGSRVFNDMNFAAYRVVYGLFGDSGNRWPAAVATASPAGGDIPLTVNFQSQASTDPDGSVVSVLWNFGDGSTSTAMNPLHSYPVAGEYVATLSVTDNGGAETVQALRVLATPPNMEPVAAARAVPASGPAPLKVVLYADNSYDPDGFIGNIKWEFSDGGVYWGSPAYHTFQNQGLHSVTLTVFDSRGASATTGLTVDVGPPNQPPLAVASATPAVGEAPLAVQFSSGGSSDPDGTIVSSVWDFGDGSSSPSANPSHTFLDAGVYAVTLTVVDNNGASGSASVTVTATGVLRSTNISLSAKIRRGSVQATGLVTVQDAGNKAVPSATIAAHWTKPDGSVVSATAITNSSGVAQFDTSGPRGTYVLSLDDIMKSGYTFDAASSVLNADVTR